MNCDLCSKNPYSPTSQIRSPIIQTKMQQLQALKHQLLLQKNKLNQTLNNNVITLSSQKRLQNNFHQVFEKKLSSVITKQNKLGQVKKIKKKIQQKAKILERYKSQRNQKFKQLYKYEETIEKTRIQILQNSETNIKPLQKIIEKKKQFLKSLYQRVKYCFQEIKEDFSALLKLQQRFVSIEKKILFQIKKVDELQLLNYIKPEDLLVQSFYELENIQQVVMRKKTSEKGLQIIFQNVLIMLILQKICRFWLPYPINCEINFNESKLMAQMRSLSICDKNMIDFGKSTKLSMNIVQFLPEQMKRMDSKENVKEQNGQQFFQLSQNDESIEYNKRKYELNKGFMNYLQTNLQFLSTKYGIENRPLVFFEIDLMNRIAQQYWWQQSYLQTKDRSLCPVNINSLGFNSMLKEIQVSKIIDSRDKTNELRIKKDNSDQNRTIQEQESENSIVSEENGNLQPKTNSNYWNWFSIKQSVYEIMVPESLEAIKSNDTDYDNDDFQVLQQ